ncbi:hypothetical protein HGRIS_004994 [Hohenbuehelia grisea]|uniref:Uncharacterized protein n=1 Tax=Hohenbuehelia grisea TaxID=104357 RepID=A0ABR3JDV1_9AGAR
MRTRQPAQIVPPLLERRARTCLLTCTLNWTQTLLFSDQLKALEQLDLAEYLLMSSALVRKRPSIRIVETFKGMDFDAGKPIVIALDECTQLYMFPGKPAEYLPQLTIHNIANSFPTHDEDF